MTPEQFCNWLQGYVDLTSSNHHPNEDQWEIIKSKLKCVNAELIAKQNIGWYGVDIKAVNPVGPY